MFEKSCSVTAGEALYVNSVTSVCTVWYSVVNIHVSHWIGTRLREGVAYIAFGMPLPRCLTIRNAP